MSDHRSKDSDSGGVYACMRCEWAGPLKYATYDQAVPVCPKCGGSLQRWTMEKAAQEAGAGFYTLPSELKVNEQIDPLLRTAVAAINASGWIFTCESCQGHPDETELMAPWGFQIEPYLRLTCPAGRVGVAVELMLEAARDDTGIELMGPAGLKLYTRALKNNWMELKVYVEARNVAGRNRGCQLLERFGFLAQKVDI